MNASELPNFIIFCYFNIIKYNYISIITGKIMGLRLVVL